MLLCTYSVCLIVSLIHVCMFRFIVLKNMKKLTIISKQSEVLSQFTIYIAEGVNTASVVVLRWLVTLSTWTCLIYILKWQMSKVCMYTYNIWGVGGSGLCQKERSQSYYLDIKISIVLQINKNIKVSYTGSIRAMILHWLDTVLF